MASATKWPQRVRKLPLGAGWNRLGVASEFPTPIGGSVASTVSPGRQVVHSDAGKSPPDASKQPEGVVISDQFASLFESSDRAERYRAQLMDLMETRVYPTERVDGGVIL